MLTVLRLTSSWIWPLYWAIFFIVGESVAFYFGWMTCFTWTLVPIAFVGILLYFFKPRGVTVDDNPLLPLYEILMAFWAISFLAVSKLFIWKNRDKALISTRLDIWNFFTHCISERPTFHPRYMYIVHTCGPRNFFINYEYCSRAGSPGLL